MVERTTVKETEASGEYGEQVIAHGKTAGGVYKPIYIADDGSVKIDPAPPDVNAIADQVWDELLADHVADGSMGKKLNDIPTTPMRGTDNAFLAADGANLPDDADIGDLPWDEPYADHDDVTSSIGYVLVDAWRRIYKGVAYGSGFTNLPSDKSLYDVIALDRLDHATYGLSALKDEIDANEAKIDALPNDADIGDLPWDEDMIDHEIVGSTGEALYVSKNKSQGNYDMLSNTTYGLSALNTKILNIINKGATPYYKVYPVNANPTGLSSSATVWTYGSWAEVIAANAITNTFWIVGYMLLHEEAQSVYAQLSIGTGASGSESEIFVMPYRHLYVTSVGNLIAQTVMLPIPYKVAANTRVAVRIQDSQASARTYSVYLLVVTGGL